MERSGRRETISTREKSLSARSRSVGRVRGKSIIVPRMRTSGSLRQRAKAADVIACSNAGILQRTSSVRFRMTVFELGDGGNTGTRASYHQWASWVRERVPRQMAERTVTPGPTSYFPLQIG